MKSECKHDIEAVRRAVAYCGTMKKLADQIGMHRYTVVKWVYGHASPSAESCIKIEKATKKHVKRKEVRSDIDW